MDSEDDSTKFLPYGCDYAKSGRATCKGKDCKQKIAKNELRICARRENSQYGGIMQIWFHVDCFFQQSRRGLTEAEIFGFEHLKQEDQERLRAGMKMRDETPKTSTRGTKNARVETTSSSRSKCKQCSETIEKDSLRIHYNSSFYHPECLAEKHVYLKQGNEIDGFEGLDEADQETLRELFTGKTDAEVVKEESTSIAGSIDKLSLEELKQARASIPDGPDREKLDELIEHKEALKNQTDLIFQARKDIEAAMEADKQLKKQTAKKDFLRGMVEDNFAYPSPSDTAADYLQLLADIMVFGAFAECPECSYPNFRYNDERHRYECAGDRDKGKQCSYKTRNPKRKPFNAGNFEALSEYSGKQLLPEGRVYSKTVQEGAEEARLVSKATSLKKIDLSRKRKKEDGGVSKENGFSVDAQCEEADDFHVFIENGNPHQFLLHNVHEHSGDQGFYKMQLLESDDENKWRLFRRYGVILAAAKPKVQQDDYDDFNKIMKEFEKVFREKTGYKWSERHEDLKPKENKYQVVEWNIDMKGTYGRSTSDTLADKNSGDSPSKKVKQEEHGKKEEPSDVKVKPSTAKKPAKKAKKTKAKKAVDED